MNTKPVKKTKLWIILISLFVVIEVLLIGATLAWFTDQKSSSATLKFGVIELDDTGSNATGLAVSIARGETTLTSEEEIMPGDKVDININVKLKTTSQPAYYLVYLEHDELFGDKEFFFKSGTTVYATDGTKIYPVSETGTIDTETESEEVAGKISRGETHTLAFSLTIEKAKETLPADKEILCTVYAIQQANLTAKQAYDEISAKRAKDEASKVPATFSSSWKTAITNSYSLKSLGFYYTGEQPSTLTLNSTLTSDYNELSDIAEADKDKIEVYSNGDNSEIAFVSNSTIMAPENCCSLFEYLYEVENINLDNFDTSNVTNMVSMFGVCNSLTTIDVSKFNTSNVVDMCSYSAFAYHVGPFRDCEKLQTIIGLESWDISAALTGTNGLRGMFACCPALTSLDISSWDISGLETTVDMFYKCSSLSSLDLSGWDTSKVTSWRRMFSETFSNNYSGSELIIGKDFTYDDNGTQTPFTKAELINKTGLNENVKLYKMVDGVKTLITE